MEAAAFLHNHRVGKLAPLTPHQQYLDGELVPGYLRRFGCVGYALIEEVDRESRLAPRSESRALLA